MKTFIILQSTIIVALLVSCSSKQGSTSSVPSGDTLVHIVTFGPEYDDVIDTIAILNEDGTKWLSISPGNNVGLANPAFKPFVCYPDYYELVLREVSHKGDRYEIIANEDTGDRKFVIVDGKKLKVDSFQNYLLKSAVGFSSTPLKSIEGEPLEDLQYEDAMPMAIKGDWLKMEFSDLNNVKTTGWIRWKKGNAILVEINKD